MSAMPSSRTRFIFDDAPVRGAFTRLEAVWQEIRQQKNYPEPIAQLLGELLAAGVLLTSNLKLDGALTLQIQSQGTLSLLVVEVTSDFNCRATARWHDEALEALKDFSLNSLTEKSGQFVVTLQPDQGEAWQGVVAITGQSVAQMLMDYMAQSEQLPTFIYLGCSDECVGGLLLQRLPESEEMLETDGQWHTLQVLGQTLTQKELLTLDAHTLLQRLFHEYSVRVFDNEAFVFACTCNVEKVSAMLKLLGGEEVAKAVLEQGSIEIVCDFCQKQYVFDEADVNEIFEMDVLASVRDNEEMKQPKHLS